MLSSKLVFFFLMYMKLFFTQLEIIVQLDIVGSYSTQETCLFGGGGHVTLSPTQIRPTIVQKIKKKES